MKLYQTIDQEFSREFWALVGAAKKIALTVHHSPDEDAIGSLMAVSQIIKQRHSEAELTLAITGLPVERFASFPLFSTIQFVIDIADLIIGADLIIYLDGGQRHRFSHEPEKMAKLAAKTICLDHHRSPPDGFDLAIIVPEEPATCSLLYQIFIADFKLDKNLAEALLLGILGDTGNFAFLKPHQTEILLLAKNLIDVAQVEIAEFQTRYRGTSLRVFRLIQELVRNTAFHETTNLLADRADWPNWQSTYLPRSIVNADNYTDNEISEASHIYLGQYIRAIKNYPWGLTITPDLNGDCGISVRSLPGSVNAREIMERGGLGGGHDRAAGGTFRAEAGQTLEPEACLKKIEEWLEKNKPLII